MRYYDLQIYNTDGSLFAQYTSLYKGQLDPNALQIEFDIPVTTLATPIGAADIKLWGVSLQTIGQASDFNGKLLKLYAGMQKGLPLANPAQAGLIVQGTIFQAFGNWINTAQWVEFIVVTDGGLLDQQMNITLNWKKGAALGDAVKQTLSVAAPSYSVTVNTQSNLVLDTDEAGYYTSMIQFAQYVKQVSKSIGGGTYAGVDILVTENAFNVFDATTSATPQSISFTDLIGQPTWIDPATIQVTAVLRADLQPGNYVKLPQTQVTTTAASQSQYRDKSVFQGSFLVSAVRHVGNYRQPEAESWVTVLNCNPATNGV